MTSDTKSTIRMVGIAVCVGVLIGAGGCILIFQTGHRYSQAIVSKLEAENRKLETDIGAIQGRVDSVATGIGEAQGRIDVISAGIGDGLEGIDQALLILEELGGLVERIEGILEIGGGTIP